MWSSTGNFPPTGLFDGQFTDLGSYRGCLDTKLAGAKAAWQPNYCIVSFRPIIPKRPPFHMIIQREHQKILNLFNHSDIFSSLAQTAQYFHYLYLRTGICLPNRCAAREVQKVANLVARRLTLMAGPVKCFSQSEAAPERGDLRSAPPLPVERYDVIENTPIQVDVNAAMNASQLVAGILVAAFLGLVLVATFCHLIDLSSSSRPTSLQAEVRGGGGGAAAAHSGSPIEGRLEQPASVCDSLLFRYFSLITNGSEFLDTRMKRNEIRCLHGLRVFTMIWIICVHSFQYNEWAGFTRIYENENILMSIQAHPLMNAYYLVDNFFLMSGLLVSYTIWLSTKGALRNFNAPTHLIARYLRLTPQMVLVSLLYILLPLAGDGPFWFDMTHHASKQCERNWWVNVLHLQAFYREEDMCNLVGWWISVDMFYYVIAIFVIYLVLDEKPRRAFAFASCVVAGCLTLATYKHFNNKYAPTNLGTVPQVAEVWTNFLVNFFCSPYPHAYPFFLGLWLGFGLANNKWRLQVTRHAKLGWLIAPSIMLALNLSSHPWMTGSLSIDNQFVSTAYNTLGTIFWSTGFAWIILACHYDTAPKFNNFLSQKIMILLSKASFIIYLSHMLVLRTYFGVQNALIEVSSTGLLYICIGNVITSSVVGVLLCIVFEAPFMKFQRFVVTSIKPNKPPKLPPSIVFDEIESLKHNTQQFNRDSQKAGDGA